MKIETRRVGPPMNAGSSTSLMSTILPSAGAMTSCALRSPVRSGSRKKYATHSATTVSSTASSHSGHERRFSASAYVPAAIRAAMAMKTSPSRAKLTASWSEVRKIERSTGNAPVRVEIPGAGLRHDAIRQGRRWRLAVPATRAPLGVEVVAYDTLDRKDRRATTEHCAPRKRRPMRTEGRHGGDDVVGRRRQHVVRHLGLELLQPPRGDLCEHRPFVRDALAHDDVERAHAIAGHEQQAPGVNLVDLAHLSASQQRQRKAVDGGGGHTRRSSCTGASDSGAPIKGATTSERNSSTCSGARPMKRRGSMTRSSSPRVNPNASSPPVRSTRSLRAAPSLTERAAAMLYCLIRSCASCRLPPALTARTMSSSVAMKGSSSIKRRRIRL